jgi:hypothetical protein
MGTKDASVRAENSHGHPPVSTPKAHREGSNGGHGENAQTGDLTHDLSPLPRNPQDSSTSLAQTKS